MTIVINIFAGPGAGKSTTAAGLFYKMKRMGLSVELVSEYAKEKVWEDNKSVLSDQLCIFAKQNRKLTRLLDKVDFIISDSPLLLGVYYGRLYGDHRDVIPDMIQKIYETYNNYNIFLERTKEYNPNGRLGTEEDAIRADKGILALLRPYGFDSFTDSNEVVVQILNQILDKWHIY